MYERFTDGARKVMQLADAESQLFNHEKIEPEHVFFGLLKAGRNTALKVLQRLGVEPSQVRYKVENELDGGPDFLITGKRSLANRTKKVLECSMKEARELRDDYVGTEHLLLGLLRENESKTAEVLTRLGLTIAATRQEVLRVLTGTDPATE